MKSNTLQFGKAISAALFVLLLSVAGMKNALAQNQVAILQHEGNLSRFFGADALVNAHSAAASGDTITLSSGNFNGTTLTKAITIHGAGCVEDTVMGIAPTTITSQTYLDRRTSSSGTLTIEGLFFQSGLKYGAYYSYSIYDCYNVTLIRCNVSFFTYNASTNGGNASINYLNLIDCIMSSFAFNGHSATIVNSVANVTAYNQTNGNNSNTICNSVLICPSSVHLNNSTITNSIIATTTYNTVSNTTFYNCIGIKTGNVDLFAGQLNTTNMTVNSYEDAFESFTGTVTYNNSYQLKDEIASSFLGNDGTEVGIYGGMSPYNTRPYYMIIRTINVAGRTTEDDKLNVQIELHNGN